MSRTKSVYKAAYNRALDFIGDFAVGEGLPPETALSRALGISRTTVRAVLEHLDENGLIAWQGRSKQVLRAPGRQDYFGVEETRSTPEKVELAFMEYVLGGDLEPGTILRESDLVREFGVSTSAVREFLIRFSRFGLIAKEPNRHWVLNGFNKSFAEELFAVREMFESRAFQAYVDRPLDDRTRPQLAALADAHRALREEIDERFLEFSRLDERFHRHFIATLDNRFVDDFYELVSLIFHFHYRWNKADERERNLVAVDEHLNVLEPLLEGRTEQAARQFQAHLQSARRTLLNSVHWD